MRPISDQFRTSSMKADLDADRFGAEPELGIGGHLSPEDALLGRQGMWSV